MNPIKTPRMYRTAAVAAVLTALVFSTAPRASTAQTPTPPQVVGGVVDTVLVRGNQRVSAEAIRGTLGIVAGDTIYPTDVPPAIKRLWASGQFSDVKLYAQEDATDPQAPVAMIVEVVERPLLRSVDIRGLENVSEGTVRDSARLRTGQPFNPATVERAKGLIRSILVDKGYQVRRLDDRTEPVTDAPGEVRLVIEVEEGRRVAIAEVEFEGNDVYSDEALRDVMQTKKEGFWWFRGGSFDEAALRTDLRQNLPSHYARAGYIDFRVAGDTLIVDPETGKARLVVSLEEGPQYRLLGFDIEGNRRFPRSDLERYFQNQRRGLLSSIGGGRADTTSAPVFNAVEFESATGQIQQRYRNEGYLYAQVEPRVEKTTTAAGEPAVQVGWTIEEGQPAYITSVSILGNTFTHESVIRDRLALLPGDVYSEEALLRSYESIAGLGFFETPMPLPRMEPNEQGDVDITFEVKEKQTGSVNFGTAVGGYGGLAGFLGYDQPNLFGKAKSGHLRWEFGRYQNNFEASYTDPSIADSRISGSFSLFSARNNFSRAFRFEEGEQRRTGLSFRFGLPLPTDRWSRLMLGYSLARTSYEQFDDTQQSVFALPPGVQSTMTLGLARNTLNHPIFPTLGTRHELNAELTGGPLGGTGDFQKYTMAGSWYVPVGQIGGTTPGSRPIRFTLGLNADAGILAGDASRFPFERFFMGGVQYGRPLRGYDETTITPLGYFPECRGQDCPIGLEQRFGDAYLRLSGEYAIRVNDNLSLAAFYDAGRLWREPAAINPTRLFKGAGLGVTLVTPFGPMGLDYAYGFDKDEPGWQLHFKLGQQF